MTCPTCGTKTVEKEHRLGGRWQIYLDWGDGDLRGPKYATDEDLVWMLADRYGIVNHVKLVGEGVDAHSRAADAALGVGQEEAKKRRLLRGRR